ncbi:hypothetical protein GOBAR_DD15843 [Gossypium barbadense]|nr:hypothetical protein GOBAR_DD15843 [Gossypium barbadense]
MKARINAKILRRCGRRIVKFFYKFPVSTNPVKFVEMELAYDEDVETMVDLYCGNGSDKNAPIHLFAELVGMEQNASDEEYGAEGPRMVAPIPYVDSESTMGGIGIDLNITPDVDMVGGEEECACEEGGGDHWDEEVDSDGDPDVDDVPDDIDNEDINASSIGEQMRHILIHNNSGPHMSLINPDAVYVAEFPEYPKIVHRHGLAVTSDDEELFIGQRFNSYELEPHMFRQKMIRLESDMEGQTNTSFRQWLGTMEPWKWAQSFDEGFRYGQMTTNLVEGINVVLLKTRHLPIASVFSATFYRLATLMPRMGQQQVDQIEAGHVFIEHVRDTMVANRRLARSMNVEIYSRQLETFRVTESISRRPGIPTRLYRVDLQNRRCECRSFSQTEGCGGIREVVRSQVESVMKWTSGRSLTESVVEYAVLAVYLFGGRRSRSSTNVLMYKHVLYTPKIRWFDSVVLAVYLFGGRRSRSGCPRRQTFSFGADGGVVPRSAATNVMHLRESHNAADIGRTSRIRIVQSRMHILALRGSVNCQCLTIPNDSYLNRQIQIVPDLAGAPTRAPVVPKNNMPWDLHHAGSLWPIPYVAACVGGLQPTGLRINMASHN